MAPKFKGGSEDWLDDEVSSTSKGKAPAGKSRAPQKKDQLLPFDQGNATVIEVYPKQCRARLDGDMALNPSFAKEILCAYRRASVVGKSEVKERSPLVVGDRVKVRLTGSRDGVVEGVCVRKNQLARPAPGREAGNVHVVAANLDLLVVVASVHEPDFSMGIVDRYLVAAANAGIPALVCVTKADLISGEEGHVEPPWQVYLNLGFDLRIVCAKTNQGIPGLRKELEGKTVVFCGHSGVGKTSLLRVLLESDIGRIGTVSQATGKGRHTTSSAVLYQGPGNSRWIDTPGVREFGLADLPPERLKDLYPEFASLACSVTSCLHRDEEGCQAKLLPRYPSYRRILESLLSDER